MGIVDDDRGPRLADFWFAAAYGGAAAGAYAYFVSLQLGWRPPRVGPWDGAAAIIQDGSSALVLWFACMGVGTTLAEQFRRKWLAEVVLLAGVFMGAMVIQSTLNLSPKSTVADVLRVTGFGIASGLGMAVAVAMVGRLAGGEHKSEPATPLRPRQLFLLGVLCLGVSFAVGELVVTRERSDGETVVVARFETGTAWLEVAKHRVPILGDSAGVLRVGNRRKSNALVLADDEWPSLTKLVASARMSPDPKWRVMGDVNDASPGDPTTLTLSAGAGLRFELVSPGEAPVAYEIRPADVSRLRTALDKVGSAL